MTSVGSTHGAAVKLADKPDQIQTQAEVWFFLTPLTTRIHGLEDVGIHRQKPALVEYSQLDGSGSAFAADQDATPGPVNIHGIADEFVQGLGEQ